MNLLQTHTPTIYAKIKDIAPDIEPWDLTDQLPEILERLAVDLGDEYEHRQGSYIHKTAKVHPTAILSDCVIIEANASVGPHAMLRGGVWICEGAHIGGSGEIKQSIVGPGSAAAHLNYIGNSIVGADVNIEAGAVLANHHNERQDKTVWVLVDGQKVMTGVQKFGSLVGDHSRIGANAVTSPGTILEPNSIVGRLELIQQLP